MKYQGRLTGVPSAATPTGEFRAHPPVLPLLIAMTILLALFAPGSLLVPVAAEAAGTTTVSVQKALGGVRKAAGDQFTVQLRTNTAAGAVVASGTTTGSGATVDPGTGSTGDVAVTAGSTYAITETGSGTADLGSYSATLTCVDANGLQPNLPNGAAFGASYRFVPVDGAAISCTLTNGPVLSSGVNLTKTADGLTGPDASGVYTASYTILVKNTTAASVTYAELVDSADFADNLEITRASWTTLGAGAGGSGSVQATSGNVLEWRMARRGATLQAGGTHTFLVKIEFHHVSASSKVRCGGPGTGLYNSASLPAGVEAADAGDNSDCMTAPLMPAPAIAVDKKVLSVSDVNGNGRTDAGDEITYGFDVTNSGDVPLTGVGVTDVLAAPAGPALRVTCPKSGLAVGEVMTCTAAPYTVTAADAKKRAVVNTATATGVAPAGSAVSSPSDSTRTPTQPGGGIQLPLPDPDDDPEGPGAGGPTDPGRPNGADVPGVLPDTGSPAGLALAGLLGLALMLGGGVLMVITARRRDSGPLHRAGAGR